MEQNLKAIDKIVENSEFKSKRNLLMIISIVFIAMNVTGANLVEANTFIFKVTFTNTLGLGYLFFASVITLMLRYYSIAYQYQRQFFQLWSGAMLTDYRVFEYKLGEGNFILRGLLKKRREFQFLIDIEDYDKDRLVLRYIVNGVFKRKVAYRKNNVGIDFEQEFSLNEFSSGWTRRDLFNLFKIEIKYQLTFFFRRPEWLEIQLPYFIGFLSLLSFIFKSNIHEFF